MNTTEEKNENTISRNNQTQIAVAITMIGSIKEDVTEIKRMLQQDYVRLERFIALDDKVITIQDESIWLKRTIVGTIIGLLITAGFAFLTK